MQSIIQNLDNGLLKPIDIFVLAGLATTDTDAWTQIELALRLGVSQSNVHRALKQLKVSRLLSDRSVRRLAFHELATGGLQYVFPAELGPPARGMPTAHAGPGTNHELTSPHPYVWPWEHGAAYGPSLLPIHPAVPDACATDEPLYELLSLIDVFRIGRVRERQLADQRLREILTLELL